MKPSVIVGLLSFTGGCLRVSYAIIAIILDLHLLKWLKEEATE